MTNWITLRKKNVQNLFWDNHEDNIKLIDDLVEKNTEMEQEIQDLKKEIGELKQRRGLERSWSGEIEENCGFEVVSCQEEQVDRQVYKKEK